MTKQEQGKQKQIGNIIAKAWNDESFKKRLLANATTVLKEEGVDVPTGLEVRAIENTDKLIHLIIPAKPVLNAENLRAIADRSGPFVMGCNCWQGEAWN